MTYNAVLFVLGVGAIILSAVIAVYGEMIFGVYEMMIDAEGAPCEKLPSISDAEKIIEEHNETFKKLKVSHKMLRYVQNVVKERQ